MTVYIGVAPIGVVAIENGKILEIQLFRKSPTEVADKLKAFEEGRGFEELDSVILKLGEKDIDRNLDNPVKEFLVQNFRKLAIERGFVADEKELNKFLVDLGIARSKTAISVTEKRDRLIVHAVSAVNDLDKILNMMSERLREWYGLHYPELNVRDHEKFANKIAKFGDRKNFEGFVQSVGIEISEEDSEVLQSYATNLANLYKNRKKLERYLDKITQEEIPNLRALLGGVLAARLLSYAGTLEKLAKMPSSKLQLLGAEKSVFRFLKEKKRGQQRARPPRFGILFTHPDVGNSPDAKRGKIARLLAAKLTVAARTDFYSKENRGEQLKKEFEKKLKEVLK